MRVFFTNSFRTRQDYKPYTDVILSILKKAKVTVITAENRPRYLATIRQLEIEGYKSERAHYEFVTRSIAEADIMIVEASTESFRLGHEVTLALLYGKPTLVVAQHLDYSTYITHNLLVSAKYTTEDDLAEAVNDFLKKTKKHFSKISENTQTIGMAVDNMRMVELGDHRGRALRDPTEFGDLARLAEEKPDQAFDRVQKALGHLPIGEALSVFAPIYQENTPDYILGGAAQFARKIFTRHGVKLNDPIVDVMTHTGALARHFADFGYQDITAFDTSRPMLAEAFRLCADRKSIKIIEANPASIQLPSAPKGMMWLDFTTNLALTSSELQRQLQNLVDNLAPGGCIVFDVRTITGWHFHLFSQKVATFATDNFQRIQLNSHDEESGIITFDLFVRLCHGDGTWSEWRRERTVERMWLLRDIKDIIGRLNHTKLDAIYGDDFLKIRNDEDPGLAYFALKKI